MNYGDGFGAGEDRDPVIGNNRGSGRFAIPGDIRRRDGPFICGGLPSFVTVKGGDYFFIQADGVTSARRGPYRPALEQPRHAPGRAAHPSPTSAW